MNKVAFKIYQAGGVRSLGLGLLFTVTLFLSACGFHLKGMGEAATATYHSIKIVQNSGVRNDLAQVLTQQFQSMGVKVVGNLANAELVLNLQATQLKTSITARDAYGNVSGELLKMVQPFNAQVVATEKEVITAQAVAFRDRSVNAAQAQASNRELQSIKRQMVTEVALQVIDRLNRAYAKLQPLQPKVK
ncbi:LPS-assembly lipoprotein LptE [Hydrogenovibrio kuenenii]|uniref:LPS-assembly lipoprotein LptE n=1 Tax=Hydrogenovibrio kuenenii TaxID=63658 RepID=UPI000466ED5A|nr:hypothetical protein [Hydrogenovibrio kuenenii]